MAGTSPATTQILMDRSWACRLRPRAGSARRNPREHGDTRGRTRPACRDAHAGYLLGWTQRAGHLGIPGSRYARPGM